MLGRPVTSEFIQTIKLARGGSLLMTRLTPPAQQSRLLVRQRIDTLVARTRDYPVTLVVAPAGSGKTTALAGLAARGDWPTAWCRMSASDDPIALLRHIAAAFLPLVPRVEERISPILEQLAEPAKAYLPQAVIDPLVNELAAMLENDTLLILDDYHSADWRPELRDLIDQLLAAQPPRLHLVLATRHEPLLASLPVRRARGEVLTLNQHDLAFTPEETQGLFALYAAAPKSDIAWVTEVCRGWPLALQMLAAHGVQQKLTDLPADEQMLGGEPGSSAAASPDMLQLEVIFPLLDEYLTQQVFDSQPPEVQNFLLRTAGLRWFDPELYTVLPGLRDEAFVQAEVERRMLFVEALPQGRQSYQPLFKSFLERMALHRLPDRGDLHLRSAVYYRDKGDAEGSIHHLLLSGEYLLAAEALEQASPNWIRQGRSRMVVAWLERLPEECRRRPALLEVRAAASRSLSEFEQALAYYQQAEAAFREQGDINGQVRVLRGWAEVYLDTVQPAPAVALLKQAMRLLPHDHYAERADILRLQAENWANRGRADVALKLETCARYMAQRGQESASAAALSPSPLPPISPTLLIARLMLRSGRLNEAMHQLETDLGLSPQGLHEPPSPVLAHREPALLLSLVYALMGKDARALAMARRGLLEAQQGGSHLTEAIAHMRVGHAYQVIPPLDFAAASRHYQRALELLETVGVPRTRVEGYMGLALLYGHNSDLGGAEAVAQEGLQIAEKAGDDWIAALIWLALGGAGVVSEDERTAQWLNQAQQRFVRGSDTYGQAVVALWLAIWHLRMGETAQVKHYVAHVLELAKQHGYEGLLTAPTLYGPRDLAMLIPILLQGRSLPEYATYAQQLLRQAFPSIASDEMVDDYHPGYTLRIQMLGSFRVWRGIREVQAREWQREKARQLLQLLLTYRGQWLQREQICAWLWPESDLDAAERQFKVTLNALNTALEPLRPPRTMPFFVRRQGLAYSFAPSYGCWIDVDEFELRTTSLVQSDAEFFLRNSQIAVQLYKGDYLAESLYDPWTLEERERLMARYLATATALAERLLERGDIQQTVQLCERVLRRDRCYEEAYQVLMRAYARSGSRSQSLRTYARCVHALDDELGIEPLPETTELYERIKRNERV